MGKHSRDEMIHTLAWNHGHPDVARYLTASQGYTKAVVSAHTAQTVENASYQVRTARQHMDTMNDMSTYTWHQRLPQSPVMRTEGHWKAAAEGLN